MADLDIKKLQSIELDALREIGRVCGLLEIKWFLVGGSALGAARHKGFIPWDDDADVGMFRDDYRVFTERAPALLDKRYFLQTLSSDEGYHLGYGKLRVNGTVYAQENVVHRKMHQGVFVDIYPIDNVPDEKIKRKRQELCEKLCYALCRGEPVTKQGKAIKLITTLLTGIFTKRFLKRIGMFFDRKIECAPDTAENVANVYGIKTYQQEIMPREYIGKTALLEFCSEFFPVPEQYDKYLSHLYGDYAKLPPEEERQLKHPPVEWDF